MASKDPTSLNIPMLVPFAKDDIGRALANQALLERGYDPRKYAVTYTVAYRTSPELVAALHVTGVEPIVEPQPPGPTPG